MAALLVNERAGFVAIVKNVSHVFRLSRARQISRHGTHTRRSLCSATGVQYLSRGNNKAIAYRTHHPKDLESSALPGIVFLTDFHSNMEEPKSQALESYCEQKNMAYVRYLHPLPFTIPRFYLSIII